MNPHEPQPTECPYCHAPTRPDPGAVNGLTPQGDARGCEYCNPAPAPAGDDRDL